MTFFDKLWTNGPEFFLRTAPPKAPSPDQIRAAYHRKFAEKVRQLQREGWPMGDKASDAENEAAALEVVNRILPTLNEDELAYFALAGMLSEGATTELG